jgi:hypothetical protein
MKTPLDMEAAVQNPNPMLIHPDNKDTLYIGNGRFVYTLHHTVKKRQVAKHRQRHWPPDVSMNVSFTVTFTVTVQAQLFLQ